MSSSSSSTMTPHECYFRQHLASSIESYGCILPYSWLTKWPPNWHVIIIDYNLFFARRVSTFFFFNILHNASFLSAISLFVVASLHLFVISTCVCILNLWLATTGPVTGSRGPSCDICPPLCCSAIASIYNLKIQICEKSYKINWKFES